MDNDGKLTAKDKRKAALIVAAVKAIKRILERERHQDGSQPVVKSPWQH
jgi:hypothetical protein